jgi:hypothetical protein
MPNKRRPPLFFPGKSFAKNRCEKYLRKRKSVLFFIRRCFEDRRLRKRRPDCFSLQNASEKMQNKRRPIFVLPWQKLRKEQM